MDIGYRILTFRNSRIRIGYGYSKNLSYMDQELQNQYPLTSAALDHFHWEWIFFLWAFSRKSCHNCCSHQMYDSSSRQGCWIQIGIVSWGYFCGKHYTDKGVKHYFPGYYTNVFTVLPWIHSHIANKSGLQQACVFKFLNAFPLFFHKMFV